MIKKFKKNEDIGVFVAAGSRLGGDPIFEEMAYTLGEYLGRNGYTYLQGASKRGLMGATYNGFIKYSKKIKMHLWNIFDDEKKFIGIKTTHRTLSKRLDGFLKDTDILIVLPGANGTLHELSTFFEYSRYAKAQYNYQIILVNIKGFYDGFLQQIDRQLKDGFYRENNFNKLISVVENIDEVIKLLPNLEKKEV